MDFKYQASLTYLQVMAARQKGICKNLCMLVKCFSVNHQLLCTCRWLRVLGLSHTGLHSGSSLAARCRCSDTAGRPPRCSPDHTDTRPRRSNCSPRSVKTHCRPGTCRGLLGQLKPTEGREERRGRGGGEVGRGRGAEETDQRGDISLTLMQCAPVSDCLQIQRRN